VLNPGGVDHLVVHLEPEGLRIVRCDNMRLGSELQEGEDLVSASDLDCFTVEELSDLSHQLLLVVVPQIPFVLSEKEASNLLAHIFQDFLPALPRYLGH
jgi:hypothetical protein